MPWIGHEGVRQGVQLIADGAHKDVHIASRQVCSADGALEERVPNEDAVVLTVDETDAPFGVSRRMDHFQIQTRNGQAFAALQQVVGNDPFDRERQGPDRMPHRVHQTIGILRMNPDLGLGARDQRGTISRVIPVGVGQQDIRDGAAALFGSLHKGIMGVWRSIDHKGCGCPRVGYQVGHGGYRAAFEGIYSEHSAKIPPPFRPFPIFVDTTQEPNVMLDTYLPLMIMIAVGVIFGVSNIFLAEWLGPRRTTAAKKSTYESGMEPVKSARERFTVKFYLVAMMFILFDIEVVFMYPWAVQFKELGMYGFVAMILFMILLFAGYIYVIKKGALRWD